MRPGDDDKPVIYPALAKTPQERAEALERLLSMDGQGYMSDGTPWTREDANER